MKKVILGLLALLGAAVVVVLILAATKPTEFTVQRRVVIAAPPEAVFAVIGDLGRFSEWSPWQRLDPNMSVTRAGAPATVGQTYAWRGNDQVGEGRMTTVRVEPNRLIGMRLDFLKPFAATNHVDWRLTPSGGGTEMAWIMTGDHNFMSKVMCVFMDMDSMVGGDFERGLANLERVVERGAR